MEVTQTSSQGLKHEYKVVLPAGELAAKLAAQLTELQAKSQIKGFRPGKAPIGHLKKLYGKSIMSDVLQEAVNDANRKIVEDNELRIALEHYHEALRYTLAIPLQLGRLRLACLWPILIGLPTLSKTARNPQWLEPGTRPCTVRKACICPYSSRSAREDP